VLLGTVRPEAGAAFGALELRQVHRRVEQALSSQRHLHLVNCPLIVAYGTLETPEFQRQSRDFAAAVQTLGKPVQLLVGDGYNHFEMPETFANPYGLLGARALEQMKLAPA
jgi:arylformamidase